MPTYEYACENCGHEFERFQSITAGPLKKCPVCGKLELRRLIGAGGGVIFKGSGFYQTDYRSESYKKAAESETKAQTGATTKDGEAKAGAEKKEKSSAKPTAAKSSTESSDKRKAG